ncbi:polymer-forming cytoskeletal protein [uncultured Endozoicomonas sp.]|uniref:bactofilin family protein n=1 Tax=uncultured Endozoicomonas sp. TaxID=432652 RepID=UPI00261C40C4|nr:polymer-forming cytoskeletal protein [uncultured Endozoicomonas sp.]
MFSRKKEADNSKSTTTLISPETNITGDIVFAGAAHVEGNIHGNISSDNGQLIIVKTATITGDIHARHVVIYGTVNGNVYSEKYLELVSGAVINGKVFYNEIEMEKGAQVNGSIEYRPGNDASENS